MSASRPRLTVRLGSESGRVGCDMERLGDDLSLNKLFVREVEKRRCLYDYTYHDYSNKELQERSWLEIAEVVGSSGKCQFLSVVVIWNCQFQWLIVVRTIES